MEFKKQLDKQRSYLVSNFDIMKKIRYPNKTKIIIYSDLANITDIKVLLPDRISAVFILIKESSTNAHWTVLIRENNELLYFDSYGVCMDGELKNINQNQRIELNENHKYLLDLVTKSEFKTTFNHIQFQEYTNGDNIINTCGKWTTVFTNCCFCGLDLKQFQTRMIEIKGITGLTYDNLICMIYDCDFKL